MKKILTTLVAVLIGYLPLHVDGQSGRLEGGALARFRADSARVDSLNELLKQHLRSDPDKARHFGEEALDLARDIGYESGVYKLTNNLGVLHSNQGHYDTALVYHQQNLEHFRKVDNHGRTANCLVNIGGVKFMQGNYESALEDYNQAFSHYFTVQDTANAMHVLNNVGTIYQDQGRLAEALTQFMTVLEFWENSKDSSHIAPALLNVGMVYQMRGQHQEAERFFTRALEITRAMNDRYRSVAAMNSLAISWSEMGRHEDAAQLHEKAARTASEMGDQFGLAEAYIGRANEYSYFKQADSVVLMGEAALEICQNIGRKSGEAHALVIIGEGQLMQGKVKAALTNLQKGVAIADTVGHSSIMRQGYEFLADAYAALGQFKNAYSVQDSVLKFNREINSKKNNDRITELQAKYDARVKEEAISALQLQTAENELRISRSRRRTTLLIAGSAILLFVILGLFMRFRQKKRLALLVGEQRNQAEAQRKKVEAQNKQIREINSNLEKMIEARTHAVRAAKEELDVFLYQSAHALRRPLVRVEGLVSLIQTKLTAPEDAVLLDKLGLTLQGMDSLLHKLVEVNEIQRRDPDLRPLPFESIVEKVAANYDWGQTSLKVKARPDAEVVADEFLLETLLTHCLQNALLYQNPSYPLKVTVELEEGDAETEIHITDNGKGIPDGEEEKIFDMFYRADSQTTGSGLGLYIVLKAAEKLHGTASATNLLGGGARITISFPRHFM